MGERMVGISINVIYINNKQMLRDNYARFACASSKCKVVTFKDGSSMKGAVINICYLLNGLVIILIIYTLQNLTNI